MKGMRRQSMEWGQILMDSISDKGLMFKVSEESQTNLRQGNKTSNLNLGKVPENIFKI